MYLSGAGGEHSQRRPNLKSEIIQENKVKKQESLEEKPRPIINDGMSLFRDA